MWFQSRNREVGRINLASIYAVINSAQPSQEFIALAAAEHNLYIVEKPCRLANLPENRGKNRYANVVPYDDTAIILSDGCYINASRISGYDKDGAFISTAYIATQGPLDNTIDDFYRMILEYKVSIIVMLTNVVESDQIKCARYWPTAEKVFEETASGDRIELPLGDKEDIYGMLSFSGSSVPTGDLQLKSVVVRIEDELVMGPIIKRSLVVFKSNDVAFAHPHRVVQFQYRGWPDHGVPSDGKAIRKIVRLVEEERDADPSSLRKPVLVHCSAGLGRTGAFIAVHQNIMQMHRAFDSGMVKEAKNFDLNLYQSVLEMRGCRSGMIQQPAQYLLCYKVIAEEACEMGLIRPEHNPYKLYSDNQSDEDDDDNMGDEDDERNDTFPPRRLLSQSTCGLARSSCSDDITLSNM